MSSKYKKLVFVTMFALSFLSSIYLNMELQSMDVAVTSHDSGLLPDVSIIKNVFKMILEPLRIG